MEHADVVDVTFQSISPGQFEKVMKRRWSCSAQCMLSVDLLAVRQISWSSSVFVSSLMRRRRAN